MAATVDSKKMLSVRGLVLGLLVLAVVGGGCAVGFGVPVGLSIPAGPSSPSWTQLTVDIYDLNQSHIAGHMRLLTQGRFGLFSPTETRACRLVGEEVTKFLSGETTWIPGVWVTRMEPTQIESHDTIAVFLDAFGYKYRYSRGKEKKFVGCITEAIHATCPAVRIVPPDEFRKVAYPGMAPEDIKPIENRSPFVDDPGFKGRIAPLGIRYLIRVSGWTKPW